MDSTVHIGMLGQEIAEEYLLSLGCKILERNYRTRFGEIDLIIRDGQTIAFVEVKTRRSLRFGTPAEAVTKAKQNKIKSVALYYAARHDPDAAYRFDVVEVLSLPGQKNVVNYIPDAFVM
jgi:putative endonuclease